MTLRRFIRAFNVYMFPVLLVLAGSIASADEPGDLGRVRAFDAGRVVARTADHEIVVLSLRIRWMVFERTRYLANFPGQNLAEQYLANFVIRRIGNEISEIDSEFLLERVASAEQESAWESFVDEINEVDFALSSSGIRIHSIVLEWLSPPISLMGSPGILNAIPLAKEDELTIAGVL